MNMLGEQSHENLIYSQACEFWRHKDRLKWNRLQFISAVEAGLLYAFFKVDPSVNKILLMLAGTYLVFLVITLFWIDINDMRYYFRKTRQYEKYSYLSDKPRESVHKEFLTGSRVVVLGFLLVEVFNVILAYLAAMQITSTVKV